LVFYHQGEPVSRLTITLTEPRYRALKEAAAQRGKTIGQLIDESLDFYGIKSREQALSLVRQARVNSQMREEQAVALAHSEVMAQRKSS
jgi:predicted DNA-binding ribbon-helix-helix protein